MAIQSATAKLYTGIRCWCVDKNISANLTASFTTGNKNRPVQVSGDTVYPGILVFRIYRTTADLEMIAGIDLVNERYKTYGGGNNVITPGTPRVIDDTNNSKIVSRLVCKFPTYLRIDVEKLQLPEGTTCIVSFEEGWIIEGDYPGSLFSPSPEIKDFFTFRTPWYGVAMLQPAFSVFHRTTKIKQLAAEFPQALGSITMRIRYNPGQFASLFMEDFAMATAPVKTVDNVLTLYAFTGGGSEQWNGFIPIKITPVAINNMSVSSLLTTDFDIVQVVDSSVQTTSNLTSEVDKLKGLIDNYQIVSISSIAPVKTAKGRAQISTIVSAGAIIGKLRAFGSTISATASISTTITHIQRTPRWNLIGSYTVSPGAYTIPLSGDDYFVVDPGAGVTAFRRYTGGSLSQDAAGVVVPSRRAVDVGAGGFWVASNDSNAVDWGAWGTSQNPPIYLDVPAVAVCKTTGSKFALYDSSTAYIKIYNTSGTQLTVYDNLNLNVTTPRHMQIQSLSGAQMFVVVTNSGGVRVMRYGTVWTTNNFSSLTDANEISISNDGLMLAVSSIDNNKVYILTRSSTSVGFSLTQTLTATYSNMYLDPNKQFLFLDGKSYQLFGGNFVYVRDVGYPTGSGAYTFGSTPLATQIISNTAKTYGWS